MIHLQGRRLGSQIRSTAFYIGAYKALGSPTTIASYLWCGSPNVLASLFLTCNSCYLFTQSFYSN